MNPLPACNHERRLLLAALLVSPLLARVAGSHSRVPLPTCEWCGASEAPAELSNRMQLATADEPGERMHITGTVWRADRRGPEKAPAADILLYAYHTDAEGEYATRGDETGNGRRHGHLRGWLRTTSDGRYQIDTIRPAHYPGRHDPAHIHMTITEPGKTEYWIDNILFEGDRNLTPALRAKQEGRGGSGIIALQRNGDGVWLGERDIVLLA